jgi:hypothetical protein
MTDVYRPADLLPAPGLPLLYFALAHVSLGLALGTLIVQPGMPAGFFHHPRMIAVIHLVTLGWISSSILGAFYIVAPLALGMPFRSGPKDRVAFGAYAIGVSGMVAHFWLGEYSGMAWSAVLVAAAIAYVGARAWLGLPRSRVPFGVKLHVALAFANILGAAAFGMLIAVNRMYGWFLWPPMSVAFAHGHLAAVGWAVMMVVGLSYRLIPMIVPAAMPTGRSLAWSALLLEAGVVSLAAALVTHSWFTFAAAPLLVAGLAVFVARVRQIVQQRRPPPAALPRPDWATWQTHVAFGWLLVAATCGVLLILPLPLTWMVPLGWVYGVAGLVGFLSQVVVGIQGRLLPMHAWYRQLQAAKGKPPARSMHSFADPSVAKWTLIAWASGVPVLAAGLVTAFAPAVALGAALLLAGVALNATQAVTVLSATGTQSSALR